MRCRARPPSAPRPLRRRRSYIRFLFSSATAAHAASREAARRPAWRKNAGFPAPTARTPHRQSSRRKERQWRLSWRRSGCTFRLAVAKDANAHQLSTDIARLDAPEVAAFGIGIALEDHEAITAGRRD